MAVSEVVSGAILVAVQLFGAYRPYWGTTTVLCRRIYDLFPASLGQNPPPTHPLSPLTPSVVVTPLPGVLNSPPRP